MDDNKLEMIKQIMEELQEQMKPGADDFSERLGKSKPSVEAVKIEGKLPMEGEPEMESPMGMDSGDDDKLMKIKEMLGLGKDESSPMDDSDGGDMPMSGMMDQDESLEDKLKSRLMKMRGA